MQIVSLRFGDILQNAKPYFWKLKRKKKIKIISAEILPSTLSVNNGGAYRDAIKIAHNDTASLTAP